MGRPDVARIKRDAEIAAAEAERDTAIRRADCAARIGCRQGRGRPGARDGGDASLAKQAEAQRDLDIQKAQFTEQSRKQEAQADKAYELQTNVMQQQVIAEQVKVQQIEKEAAGQGAGGRNPAPREGADRDRAEEAGDRASAHREHCRRPKSRASSPKPKAAPQRSRTQGEAEAAIIFQKGEAEAKAMNVKAEAYQEWTQAAVVDKLITSMAEVVRAMAEPLSKVDKITIVSTGSDGVTGANKLTGDMTKIAAQVPALFEALSGMKMSDLMANVKSIGSRGPTDKANRFGGSSQGS